MLRGMVQRSETAMFTIERMSPAGWTAEIECKTEFRAFLNARTKCMATGQVYRVITGDGDVACVITLEECRRQFQAR
ncbi:hypothetical protein SynRCC2555_01124 [Synechococcus sp. WH 8101]|nr:hypothetical protein RS9917_00382 [Synechococcus sp. RS9917]QNI44910.1 hypothetical protein SynRCC2555_01124 [Synechococcus sp. WH 8101]